MTALTNIAHNAGALTAATLLIPGGFILGGLVTYGSEPGLGIVLLPVGAILLLVALFKLAKGIR